MLSLLANSDVNCTCWSDASRKGWGHRLGAPAKGQSFHRWIILVDGRIHGVCGWSDGTFVISDSWYVLGTCDKGSFWCWQPLAFKVYDCVECYSDVNCALQGGRSIQGVIALVGGGQVYSGSHPVKHASPWLHRRPSCWAMWRRLPSPTMWPAWLRSRNKSQVKLRYQMMMTMKMMVGMKTLVLGAAWPSPLRRWTGPSAIDMRAVEVLPKDLQASCLYCSPPWINGMLVGIYSGAYHTAAHAGHLKPCTECGGGWAFPNLPSPDKVRRGSAVVQLAHHMQ